MTTIPDLGQTHDACDGVKLDWRDPNPPPTNGQGKVNRNKTVINEL